MFKRKPKLHNYQSRGYQPFDRGWRGYQKKIRIYDERRQTLRRIPWYFVGLVIFAFLIKGGFHLLEKRMLSASADHTVSIYVPEVTPLDHNSIQAILPIARFNNLDTKIFDFKRDNHSYQIHTSLNMTLQKGIMNALDTRHANRIGIIVMEPDTGRILAMVSHDDDDPHSNACLKADLPAASIFKIVTATAALEAGGLEYQSRMAFNGGKFTLYRNQLVDQENQYTNYTSLKDSFAESINPVFGKLGKNLLGKSLLENYAHAYLFNCDIEFDLPAEQSFLEISDKPFNLAEIASGFNRTTTISPLHAAMIAGMVANGGKLVKPSIVDVASQDHKTVYRRQAGALSQAIRPLTTESLQKLMNATITSGTARNQFVGISTDPILSRLDMGGKTGSINNNRRQIRYDWFAGYASNPDGSEKIAVGIIVAHKEYIGKRAATYFREIVSRYFENIN